MGALAGAGLAGGGGASVSASSSASSGPQSGTTGSLILNFGGINLGSQDIPLTQSDNQATNQPAVQGRTPTPLADLTAVAGGGSSGVLLYAVIAVAAFAVYYMLKHK